MPSKAWRKLVFYPQLKLQSEVRGWGFLVDRKYLVKTDKHLVPFSPVKILKSSPRSFKTTGFKKDNATLSLKNRTY